jgi:hypothetical protein
MTKELAQFLSVINASCLGRYGKYCILTFYHQKPLSFPETTEQGCQLRGFSFKNANKGIFKALGN